MGVKTFCFTAVCENDFMVVEHKVDIGRASGLCDGNGVIA